MDSGYLLQVEHNEFAKRMEEEHLRLHHRVKDLEDDKKERRDLIIAVNKLADNMDVMQKELKAQGDKIDEIENRDGEKWRETTKYVLFTCLGILISFVLKQIGIM